jgi:hypothetical protein
VLQWKHISNTLMFIIQFLNIDITHSMIAPRRKERQYETQFPTKIDSFLSFTPLWMLMVCRFKKKSRPVYDQTQGSGAVFFLRPSCEPVRAETLHGSQLVLRCLWWLGDQWRYVGAWIRRLLRTVAIPGFRNSGITSSAHEASPLLTSSSRRKES